MDMIPVLDKVGGRSRRSDYFNFFSNTLHYALPGSVAALLQPAGARRLPPGVRWEV